MTMTGRAFGRGKAMAFSAWSPRTRRLAASFAFCAATAAAAHVSVPVPGTVVPMTLQSAAVLLCGLVLPPPWAASTMAVYLLAGMAGLPVFSPDSLGVFGPTGGYLVGFLVAAWLMGTVRGACGGLIPLTVAAIVGQVTVLALGTAWLAWCTGNVEAAVFGGLAPFVVKAIVELLLSVGMAPPLRRWVRLDVTRVG